MFTTEQIIDTHGKVKSGADFPQYVRDLKALGVLRYDIYVSDGHAQYHGTGGFTLDAANQWETLQIAAPAHPQRLKDALSLHQRGNSDYMTFCRQSADAGVYKWTVDINALTCTYYDKEGSVIVEELIPV